MQLIPDTINLAEYMGDDPVRAKVRPASDFLAQVKQELAPSDSKPRHPTLFFGKASGLLEVRPGEVTAFVGRNGERKSMFLGQCALNLAVQGQRALIVSLEMFPQVTLARMTRQATAKKEPSFMEIERFHAWTDERLYLFDHVGRIDVETIPALMRYFRHELNGNQLILDSLLMIDGIGEEALDKQKNFITSLCRVAQETGLHVILVAHCRKPSGNDAGMPSKYDIRGSAAISDQCHNVVIVWANREKRARLEKDPMDMKALAEPDHVVSVEKQRNGAFEGRITYWFHEASLRFCDDRVSREEPLSFHEAA